jgi:murein DD-endopeptidase MepM/ murein hydrolase activator NlpD
MTATTRKAFTAFALAATLVVAAIAPSSADRRHDLEKQNTYLGHKLKSAQQSYDEADAKFEAAAQKLKISQQVLAEAQAHLDQTRGELAAARARDAALKDQLATAEDNLVQAQAELDQGEVEQESAAGEVREFAVERLQDGDPALLAFSELLRGGDPNDYAEKVLINDAISDAQLTKMQKLDAANVMLGIMRDGVETFRDEIKTKKAEAAQNVIRMQGLEADAATQADRVGELVSINARNKATTAAIRAEEASKVAAIEADRASTQRRIQALIAQQSHHGSGSNFGGDGGPLGYPIPGAPITSPYGMRVHPITGVYKLHDGTDFGAACGTPVHASGTGTVISEYYNAGYGNRLIIAHGVINGQNVQTAYNHLSRYAVSSGQHVVKGQVIAYVGSTGYSTGCHLHFMVLLNGVPTNPMNWL